MAACAPLRAKIECSKMFPAAMSKTCFGSKCCPNGNVHDLSHRPKINKIICEQFFGRNRSNVRLRSFFDVGWAGSLSSQDLGSQGLRAHRRCRPVSTEIRLPADRKTRNSSVTKSLGKIHPKRTSRPFFASGGQVPILALS